MARLDLPIAVRLKLLLAAIGLWAFGAAVSAALLIGAGPSPSPGARAAQTVAWVDASSAAMARVVVAIDDVERGQAIVSFVAADVLPRVDDRVAVAPGAAEVASVSTRASDLPQLGVPPGRPIADHGEGVRHAPPTASTEPGRVFLPPLLRPPAA